MEFHRLSSFMIVVVATAFSVDASDNMTYLLFANSSHINRASLDGSSFETLYSGNSTDRIMGVDYHYSEGYMYWSDVNTGSLNRAFLNGTSAEVLLHTEDFVIEDIALDWVNTKLYWTEATVGDVLVMDIAQRQRIKLIDNYDGSTTRAIAVDPTTRYMYWSDWGDEARIERAGMDGSNRTILHNTDLKWPNGITIDYKNQKLYWVDANLDTLEYSSVDGTGRTLLERGDDIIHPFSITLEKDFLFWTDWLQLAIFTTQKDLANDTIVSLYQLSFRPHGIEAVTLDRQSDADNPCERVNCGFSALCLLSPKPEGFSCFCTDDDEDCIHRYLCPYLETPANGNVTLTGTSPGDTATYTCNTNYDLVGDDTVTCRDDGHWKSDPPECLSHCPIPMNFTNGIVKMTGNSPGNFATYTCDHDYELVGTSILVCGENRQWSAEPPICRQSSTKSISAGVIAAIIMAFLVIITMTGVMVLILFYRRKTKQLKKYYNPSHVQDKDTSSYDYPLDKSRRANLLQELREELKYTKMIFNKDQLQLSSTIGHGVSGLVYKAYIDTAVGKELVAVKTGKALFSTNDIERMTKEVSTMLNFEHPNVMSLIGVCLDGEMPLIIMPFMSNGSVLEFVKSHREEMFLCSHAKMELIQSTRKTFLGICHQITKGMAYLSEQKFVHRDLAARNCMIDWHGAIKVADFGLTEDMYGTNYFRRRKSVAGEEMVPIRWMAPESIENDIYNESTDVWSFGVTVWEIFTCGRIPYPGIPAMGLLKVLQTGQRLEKPQNASCSDEIYEIMMSCWNKDHYKRPRFSKLVNTFGDLLESDAGYLQLSQFPISKEKKLPQKSPAESGRPTMTVNDAAEIELDEIPGSTPSTPCSGVMETTT